MKKQIRPIQAKSKIIYSIISYLLRSRYDDRELKNVSEVRKKDEETKSEAKEDNEW